MITYFDLVNNDGFRDYISKRIQSETGTFYSCNVATFPLLYKYRGITEYAVNDLIDGKATFSAIGSFNDLFDGTIQIYKSEEELDSIIETEWNEKKDYFEKYGLESFIDKDKFILERRDKHRREYNLKFRLVDYLGTYVCSMSTEPDSILMWSHYAQSNTGMCLGYNFNQVPKDSLNRRLLFPVAYLNQPMNVNDLLYDSKAEVYAYPIDAAAVLSAVSKSAKWKYEHEWRLLNIWAGVFDSRIEPHYSWKIEVKPSVIILGYHFMKPLFYHEKKHEEKKCIEILELIKRLIDYAFNESIKIQIMIPEIGRNKLQARTIEPRVLRSFINEHFRHGAQNMRFYYTLHDRLMRVLR